MISLLTARQDERKGKIRDAGGLIIMIIGMENNDNDKQTKGWMRMCVKCPS